MKRRLTLGIGANVYDKAAIALSQIVAVPIFASTLGLGEYGTWLLIFTIPSYLAFGDFGLAIAASNSMTGSLSRNDNAHASSAFFTALFATAALSATICVVGAIVIYILWQSGVLVTHIGALYFAILYGAVMLLSGPIQAGFRAARFYALGVFSAGTIYLFETTIAVTLCLVFRSVDAVAFGYLAGRAIGILSQWLILQRKVLWLRLRSATVSMSELRSLARPGWAAMALPISQAIVLQGITIVLGLSISSEAVAVYSTVRTITRIAIQFIGLMTNSIMPEMTIAQAINDTELKSRLVRTTAVVSISVSLISSVIFAVCGKSIVLLWTQGMVHPKIDFIIIMSATIAFHGIWMPFANLILAINRQSEFSYLYLFSSILMIAFSIPTISILGISGAAVSVLLLDIVMLMRIASISSSILKAEKRND